MLSVSDGRITQENVEDMSAEVDLVKNKIAEVRNEPAILRGAPPVVNNLVADFLGDMAGMPLDEFQSDFESSPPRPQCPLRVVLGMALNPGGTGRTYTHLATQMAWWMC